MSLPWQTKEHLGSSIPKSRCSRFEGILRKDHIQSQALQSVVLHHPAVVCILGICYRSTLRSDCLAREQEASQVQRPREEEATRDLCVLTNQSRKEPTFDPTFFAHWLGDYPCCHPEPYLPEPWRGSWRPRTRRARWSAIGSQQHTQPFEAACSKGDVERQMPRLLIVWPWAKTVARFPSHWQLCGHFFSQALNKKTHPIRTTSPTPTTSLSRPPKELGQLGEGPEEPKEDGGQEEHPDLCSARTCVPSFLKVFLSFGGFSNKGEETV